MAEGIEENTATPGGSPTPSRRGEVYWLDFDPASGAEMKSTDPCVIVQNDVGNQKSDLTIVVAITGNLRVANLPIGVLIQAGTAGLSIDSVAHCGHVYTIDQARLGSRLGRLPAAIMSQVDHPLIRSLAL